MDFLFVGEKRSELAKKRNVRWEDGRLAAKQLFDALRANGIDPENCHFANWFERGRKTFIRKFQGTVFGMGNRVQYALRKEGIEHVPIIHPAARGRIRKKERYIKHIGEVLSSVKREMNNGMS